MLIQLTFADSCKINNAKEDQGEKLIETLSFPKFPSAHEVLRR